MYVCTPSFPMWYEMLQVHLMMHIDTNCPFSGVLFFVNVVEYAFFVLTWLLMGCEIFLRAWVSSSNHRELVRLYSCSC